MRALARVPIRLRLTGLFALVMAVVLTVTGVFVYARVDAATDESIDASLRGRADELIPLVQGGQLSLTTAPGELAEPGETFAQVLRTDGAVVDASPALAGERLLSDDELRRAARGTVVVDRGSVPGGDDPVRLLAAPVQAGGVTLIVVVGASTDAKHEAQASLLTQLAIVVPLALLVAAGLAYALTGAALRPVEEMRREAARVSALEPSRRLPVPPADDEIARLGSTLNQMLERLEDGLDRERRFVADAGHELRTPLAALRAELDLALRPGRSLADLRAALVSAGEEAERLSRLADDLLVLARAQGGDLPVVRARLGAAELLERVRARFAARAAEDGRSLEVAVPDQLVLDADPLRLEQALGNLVENALRHGAGTVRLSAVEHGGRVELHVRDDGAGLDPVFAERAFLPFSRPEAARTTPGTGLGLAIVAVIARAHGGTAMAAGPDVWLDLPASR